MKALSALIEVARRVEPKLWADQEARDVAAVMRKAMAPVDDADAGMAVVQIGSTLGVGAMRLVMSLPPDMLELDEDSARLTLSLVESLPPRAVVAFVLAGLEGNGPEYLDPMQAAIGTVFIAAAFVERYGLLDLLLAPLNSPPPRARSPRPAAPPQVRNRAKAARRARRGKQ